MAVLLFKRRSTFNTARINPKALYPFQIHIKYSAP